MEVVLGGGRIGGFDAMGLAGSEIFPGLALPASEMALEGLVTCKNGKS